MSPIPFTSNDLEEALVSHGMECPAIWTVWDLADGSDTVDGYGASHPRLTLEKARAVALALSSVPGPAWVSVEPDDRSLMPMSHLDCSFSFLHHTGPAHQKLAAIAAMRAEVAA